MADRTQGDKVQATGSQRGQPPGARSAIAVSAAEQGLRRTIMLALGLTVLAALLMFGAQTTTKAQGSSSSGAAGRIITVSGQGVITVIPDLAQISIGVSTQNKTAAGALRANNGAV